MQESYDYESNFRYCQINIFQIKSKELGNLNEIQTSAPEDFISETAETSRQTTDQDEFNRETDRRRLISVKSVPGDKQYNNEDIHKQSKPHLGKQRNIVATKRQIGILYWPKSQKAWENIEFSMHKAFQDQQFHGLIQNDQKYNGGSISFQFFHGYSFQL